MIRKSEGLVFPFVLLAGWTIMAQQRTSQPSPQQPAPQTTVTQQQQQEQQRQEQQRQEQQRIADEQLRKEREAERQQFTNSLPLPPASVAKTAPPQVAEPCLALEMARDQSFDLKGIPLDDWLVGPTANEIPWKVQFQPPQLRLDQRYEVGYFGKIDGKDLRWSAGHQELLYISGVSSPDGQRLVEPKSARQVIDDLPQHRFALSFSDCVFLQPGEYVLWMAVFDGGTKRHSIVKKNIHIPAWSSEELPNMNSRQPAVEFPQVLFRGQKTIQAVPGPMVLPVENKQAINLDVISVLSPADQWSARADIVRAVNSRVLSATGLFSQIRPEMGSVSTVAWDLVNRSIRFEQRDVRQLNWTDLASAFMNSTDAFKVGVPALEALKEHGAFFRKTFQRQLDDPAKPMRVFIIVSGSLLFAEGADTSPIKLEGECNCRIYHLNLRVTKDDVFDDLGKLIKPFHPTTFNILTPLDFRRALAAIIQDLNRL